MRLATGQPVDPPSLDSIKMEDRKRLADRDDAAPPPKRLAVSVNGAKHPDADMPWKDDLEAYQKDAILRQMREYKREKSALEGRVAEIERNTRWHDEYIRKSDSYWSQLLDELQIHVDSSVSPTRSADAARDLNTALLLRDVENFENYLVERNRSVKATLSELLARLPSAVPDKAKLEAEVARLTDLERERNVVLQQALAERDSLNERLESASYRYMVAEKKLDRLKSAQVAKLERAASLSVSTTEETNNKNGQPADVNGVADGAVINESTEIARKEAVAAADKRKEQVDQLEGENRTLTAELTAARSRLCSLTDDDFAKSGLFKNVKCQHEELIRRVNDLEATNIQYQENAKKLSEERTAYRLEVDEESRVLVGDAEGQLAKAETDLARIRANRDELLSDQSIRKAAQDQQTASFEQLKELSSSRESRIAALETETQRLRLQLKEVESNDADQVDLAALSQEELVAKVASLQKECALLSNELPSMEAAWRKAQAVASKKIVDSTAMEEQVSRLSAEKAKADQKYFAAMKAKDIRDSEIRTLRAQNAKSSEIVSQLKESNGSNQSLAINLEKKLSETKDALANITNQHRVAQSKMAESKQASDVATTQMAELKKSLAAKDVMHQDALRTQRQAGVELEELQSRLAETKKSLESWKKKGLGNQSDEYEMLRTIAICTVCRKNFKNTAIKTCGHVFCQDCVDERIAARSRKCPNCGKSFGSNDHMRVTL